MIGVILPTLNSKVTSRVITSIDRYLRDRDYVTIIRNSDHDIALGSFVQVKITEAKDYDLIGVWQESKA